MQKTLSQRDLTKGVDLKNQTVFNSRPMYMHVLTLFCIIRLNFEEVLQKLVFKFNFDFIMK